MDKRKSNPTKTLLEVTAHTTDPNELLNAFLVDNKLVLSVTAISDENSYIKGQGFVLTDRPLLVVTATYKS